VTRRLCRNPLWVVHRCVRFAAYDNEKFAPRSSLGASSCWLSRQRRRFPLVPGRHAAAASLESQDRRSATTGRTTRPALPWSAKGNSGSQRSLPYLGSVLSGPSALCQRVRRRSAVRTFLVTLSALLPAVAAVLLLFSHLLVCSPSPREKKVLRRPPADGAGVGSTRPASSFCRIGKAGKTEGSDSTTGFKTARRPQEPNDLLPTTSCKRSPDCFVGNQPGRRGVRPPTHTCRVHKRSLGRVRGEKADRHPLPGPLTIPARLRSKHFPG